jgi:hypothetical protein
MVKTCETLEGLGSHPRHPLQNYFPATTLQEHTVEIFGFVWGADVGVGKG